MRHTVHTRRSRVANPSDARTERVEFIAASQTGAVVFLMLESPAFARTVEELAKRAHMSRASFAQLFREVSNSTPLAVLTTLRLQFAAQMLSRGRSL